MNNISMTNLSYKYANQPTFSSKVAKNDVKESQDYCERKITGEATTAAKWNRGISSLLMPGIGQFKNGDAGKGFAFIGSFVALLGGAFLAKAKGFEKLAIGLVSSILIPMVWSTVDAVKNAKSTIIVKEPKNQTN